MKQFETLVNNYENYTRQNDGRQAPKKGVNSGNVGRFFEAKVAEAMNCTNRKTICQGSYCVDVRKKAPDGHYIRYECKTGFGELGRMTNKGAKIASDNNDYIIYCMDVNLDNPLDGAYIVDAKTFINTLLELDGIKFDPARNRFKFKSDCKTQRARIETALEVGNAELLVDYIERKAWLS